MANPRVSILMITYNRPQFIAQSVASAQKQTVKDWELIVVDDSENDAAEKAMAPLARADKRIKYFHRPEKGSIANSSNFGLARASGEFVAVLDDDDWWIDDRKLEKQIKFLDAHPDYIGCGGGYVIMNEAGTETKRILKPETDAAIRRVALAANPMVNSTTMFRREAAGGYDESLRQFADFDFWLRAGTKGKLYNFPEYFLAYRIWESSSSFKNQKQNADAGYRIVMRYRKNYPGFAQAWLLGAAYCAYARLPASFRRPMNSFLSRLKKSLFAG